MSMTNLDADQVTRTVFDDDTESFRTINVSGLVTEEFDYIALGYSGSDLTTVTYKTGGAGGTTVATLTLVYSGANLVSITRT